MMKKPIIVVQGGQWGSEAKGMVAAALGRRRAVDFCVRTGTVNAGHTVYKAESSLKDGVRYVMQQLPVGWVHGADLVIGPGAYVHPEIFDHELAMVREAGYKGTIHVDNRCGLHLPSHTMRATVADRHHKMGATGKGCSEAVIEKISGRGGSGMLFKDFWPSSGKDDFIWTDTVELLNGGYDAGKQILIEGTQGTFLDLHLGPYPFTTHKQTTAAAWVTEAGLSPALDFEVVLVVRTFPIRVAGNSGPMPQEISWPILAADINRKLAGMDKPPIVSHKALMEFERAIWETHRHIYPNAPSPILQHEWTPEEREYHRVALSEMNADVIKSLSEETVTELKKLFEFTTVTKKLRRVARLDADMLRYSVMLNRPKWIALTFLNYVFPGLWGKPELMSEMIGDYNRAPMQYIDDVETACGVRVGAVTVGPEEDCYCGSLGVYNDSSR